MSSIQLDYSDITEIFKEKLKIDNIVKSISSIFLNDRYYNKIDYKPYFQRNYVWDEEKASYFIESILLGTEIPPIVLFQTKSMNEVIDGRQRFETISRFLKDKLILQEKGLHSLKSLSGKKYSQLNDEIKEAFEETRVRIIQFSIVDEPRLSDEQEDKIKKEIFRRYNSGITPLQKFDMDRAAYIHDALSNAFYREIFENSELYNFLNTILLPRSKKKAAKRDKVNILVSLSRNLITMPYIPIFSYSTGSSKSEIIGKYYEKYLQTDNTEKIHKQIEEYKKIMKYLIDCYRNITLEKLKYNNLFYEVVYWAFAILLHRGYDVNKVQIENLLQTINNSNANDSAWKGMTNIPENNVDVLFDPTGSHYYSAINNRYTFAGNIFSECIGIDYSKYLKDKSQFTEIMDEDIEREELHRYKLNKPLPETLSIEDILSDMQKKRFLIRPDYQRSEVKSLTKASYLMESIMLGIKIPPIFVFKRRDKVKEVVDGQQRLLTIIGFLGKTYLNERGERVNSDKDQFKLKSLKILPELNGKNIKSVDEKFEDKILEFPIDIIEIDSSQNPEFSPIDLFLRLNTKPYPIKENTFEMWNAYVEKAVVVSIRKIANKYQEKVFRPLDSRMKVEELITSLAYLDYKISSNNEEILSVLNIYKRYNRMNARIKNKSDVTKLLSMISNEDSQSFLDSVKNINQFANKVMILTADENHNVKKLFNHKRKGAAYKTDQNFYFLWLMLLGISEEIIVQDKDDVFKKISALFALIQSTPDNYDPESLVQDMKSLWEKS